VVGAGAAALLAGCVTQDASIPLIFGQQQTFGVSMGGDASSQGVEMTVGFKDRNIAVVPVVAKNASGGLVHVRSVATEGFNDAYSVLGQFSAEADSTAGKVGLGKFFATGLAARNLAEGFADAMRDGRTQAPKEEETKTAKGSQGAPQDGEARPAEEAAPAPVEAAAQPVSNPQASANQ
jgi:hypothetical protein